MAKTKKTKIIHIIKIEILLLLFFKDGNGNADSKHECLSNKISIVPFMD